jgi:hypothetical protein
MPDIRFLIHEAGVFTSEETQILISAFNDTLRHIDESSRSDKLSSFVARQIIIAATGGERDPEKLRDSVLSVVSALGHSVTAPENPD